jgi:CRISPR-associated protein Cas2
MNRRRFLIGYDISDDKRRTGVFKTLIAHGDHVQFSVFLCALTAKELAGLRAALSEMIHARDDQVIIVDLGLADSDLETIIDCLGKRYEPASRVRVV